MIFDLKGGGKESALKLSDRSCCCANEKEMEKRVSWFHIKSGILFCCLVGRIFLIQASGFFWGRSWNMFSMIVNVSQKTDSVPTNVPRRTT